MDQRKSRQSGNKEDECPRGVIGLGSRFKAAREESNLDYARLSKITRLRPCILEALEDEDWEKLPPSPIFVQGFIRSYARSLGLEEKELVSLYQDAFPAVDIVSNFPVPPAENRKKIFLFFLIFFLIFTAGTTYYLWKKYPTPEKMLVNSISLTDEGSVKSKDISAPVAETEPAAISHADAEVDKSVVLDNPETPNNLLREERDAPPLTDQISTFEPEIGHGVEPAELVLRAGVKEKTWIKIFVDDKDPEEYTFSPGSIIEWKAKNGFELVIGNAGGIDFEFNNEKVHDLGKSGMVVHYKIS